MTLSAVAYLEKNKLSSTGAWLILMKVKTVGGTVMRFVRNTEDVIWPVTNGNSYLGFPFELDEIGDTSKGEAPQVVIKVSNVSRAMQTHMEAEGGMVDAEITLRVVHSTHVTSETLGAGANNPNPEVELNFDVLDSGADSQWATFVIGANNPFRMRFPRTRVMRNYCKYKHFKGRRCQYTGEETTCDRSLYTCRNTMNNTENFGGAPGVSRRGVYV